MLTSYFSPREKNTFFLGAVGEGEHVVVGKSPTFLAASAWSGVPTFLKWEWGVREWSFFKDHRLLPFLF